MVGHRHHVLGFHSGGRQRTDESVWAGDGREEPEALAPKRAERSAFAARPADFAGHRVDGHDEIGLAEQELTRRSEIARRRETTAAPWSARVDGEDGECGLIRTVATTDPERTVEHEHIGAGIELYRVIDRGLTRGPDDDGHPHRRERASTDDRLVAHVIEPFVARDDART
jgi:hypothetical protein